MFDITADKLCSSEARVRRRCLKQTGGDAEMVNDNDLPTSQPASEPVSARVNNA